MTPYFSSLNAINHMVLFLYQSHHGTNNISKGCLHKTPVANAGRQRSGEPSPRADLDLRGDVRLAAASRRARIRGAAHAGLHASDGAPPARQQADEARASQVGHGAAGLARAQTAARTAQSLRCEGFSRFRHNET